MFALSEPVLLPRLTDALPSKVVAPIASAVICIVRLNGAALWPSASVPLIGSPLTGSLHDENTNVVVILLHVRWTHAASWAYVCSEIASAPTPAAGAVIATTAVRLEVAAVVTAAADSVVALDEGS